MNRAKIRAVAGNGKKRTLEKNRIHFVKIVNSSFVVPIPNA